MGVKITIDGRELSVDDGKTVLEAALDAGIAVPNLCYHPFLEPVGSCRVCSVDIEGMRGLAASCTTPAEDGMVVHTRTPRVLEYRREMLRLILQDYPGIAGSARGTIAANCRMWCGKWDWSYRPARWWKPRGQKFLGDRFLIVTTTSVFVADAVSGSVMKCAAPRPLSSVK